MNQIDPIVKNIERLQETVNDMWRSLKPYGRAPTADEIKCAEGLACEAGAQIINILSDITRLR